MGQTILDVLSNVPGLFASGGRVPGLQGLNWGGLTQRNLLQSGGEGL